MTFIQIVFYILAFVAVLSGTMVVLSHNPVRCVLFLVLTFFAMAGVWLLLQAEFLALILVLVYVGAVMTLFLFVVMMLKVNVVSVREGLVRYFPIGIVLVMMIIGLTVLSIGPEHFGLSRFPAPPLQPADYSNIAELGSVLYTDYALPFEMAAVILLTAIVAAISLTHRKPVGRKSQNINAQIAVRRSDRVRLMQVPSEKKIYPGDKA